ncbi:MAG: hypothetical protein JO333_16930 [Verrucomicrobia bacterium]|nr:hypothetical protein [Verrucomicrobiota bacterium]
MLNLTVGMKIYDNGWFLRHRLQPEEAADLLQSMGVTFVIAQSRFLPMQNSAVESAVRNEDAGRYAALDDIAFRRALAVREISYFACLNIGFDPVFAAAHPELLPTDQFGRQETMEDWYIGLPPDRAANLEHKISMLAEAVRGLSPDGVHLGFMRWPGFWETWLPDTNRETKPDYCYAPETIHRFSKATRAHVPAADAPTAAQYIAGHYKTEWRDWKCAVTIAAINEIRAAVLAIKPDLRIAINTLPFLRTDFEDAVTEVFGQDVARLREVVDIFEVMAYHQILRRDAAWPAAVGSDIKSRSRRSVVCTLQAKPLYLDGMHAGGGRAQSLSPQEFVTAVDALERSTVDGLCVFSFSDLLAMRDSEDGRRMMDRLRRFRR